MRANELALNNIPIMKRNLLVHGGHCFISRGLGSKARDSLIVVARYLYIGKHGGHSAGTHR